MIWHNHCAADVAAELQSDLEKGLTAEKAAERLAIYGKNRLSDQKKRTFLQRFAAQMKDFMVIILLIAAAVSIIVTIMEGKNDWLEPIVIVAIVVLNAMLGVIQESKAEAALDALKNLAAPHAKVVRGGEISVVSAQELVPGDVIFLEAGDFIPADARLVEGQSLRCDESALTGESIPAEKDETTQFEEIAPLGDRRNMVYAGCTVSYGRGKAIVTDTGMNTEMGKIAAMLGTQLDDVTPLQKKLAKLGKTLGAAGAGNLCDHFPLRDHHRAGDFRNVHDGGGTGGGRYSGRAARHRHHCAGHGRIPHGQEKRHHPTAAGGGNAGFGLGHLLG